MRHRHAGFTLIELLIVVSILALLIALLMPAIKLVKESAQTVRCGSNLRQLMLANVAYSSDWEGFYVPQFLSTTGFDMTYWWWDNPDLLKNFTDGKATSNTTVQAGVLCPLSKPSSSGVRSMTLSYGMNCYKVWTAGIGYGVGYTQFHSARVAKQGRKIAFIDALGGDLGYSLSSASTYWVNGIPSPEGIGTGAVAYRHGGRANVAFYDGHVSSTLPKDVWLWYVWDPATTSVP